MTESRTINIDHIGPVTFERSARARRIVITVHSQKGVRVAVPRHASFENAADFVRKQEEWIKKHLEKVRKNNTRSKQHNEALAVIDKEKAKKALSVRLLYLAEKHGFNCKRVTVRRQRTRWGSCSHNKAISLNIKIMILPDELRDYVMLHELVHTKIYNHSRKFWAELDKYVGNGKLLARKLREYDLVQIE
jgi:predicted metal-dependent hydrolase